MKIFGHTEDDYTKRHFAVHVKPGQSVSYSRTQMITGVNRHSRKSYARWELINRIGFRRTHKGTIVPFNRIGKIFRDPDPAFHTLQSYQQNPFGLRQSPADTAERIFSENVIEQFGIKTFTDVYPIAGLKELDNYRYIPPNLRSEVRALDIMDFTRRTFGVRNYRKDLVRAVANANMPTIAVAKEFKNLVPADWLVTFMRESTTGAHTYANILGLREILRHIDPRSYRRILRHEFTEHDMLQIENLTRQYRGHVKRIALGATGTITIPDESFGSFTELHDRLIGHRGHGLYREMPYKNQPIPLGPYAGRLHGTKFGEYIIAMAMETDDMIEWGKQMHNCIGGYWQNAVGGKTLYGAVYKRDEMTANFEIGSNGTLTQLLGRFNEILPDEVRTYIEVVLSGNGVKIPADYWGRPYDLIDEIDEMADMIDDPFGPPLPLEPRPAPAELTFEELLDGLQLEPEPPRTRIQLGRGVYLANGVDANGNEIPF